MKPTAPLLLAALVFLPALAMALSASALATPCTTPVSIQFFYHPSEQADLQLAGYELSAEESSEASKEHAEASEHGKEHTEFSEHAKEHAESSREHAESSKEHAEHAEYSKHEHAELSELSFIEELSEIAEPAASTIHPAAKGAEHGEHVAAAEHSHEHAEHGREHAEHGEGESGEGESSRHHKEHAEHGEGEGTLTIPTTSFSVGVHYGYVLGFVSKVTPTSIEFTTPVQSEGSDPDWLHLFRSTRIGAIVATNKCARTKLVARHAQITDVRIQTSATAGTEYAVTVAFKNASLISATARHPAWLLSGRIPAAFHTKNHHKLGGEQSEESTMSVREEALLRSN